MSVAVDISITGDTATPALQELIRKTGPNTVATRIVPPIREMWRSHLAGLPRNRNGWPSTGFWQDAARRVQGVAVDGTAIISSDKLGLRQRLYGGTIAARNVKNLTIPICAEAYGTTVADWGYDNLVLVITSTGTKFLALWLGYDAAQQAYRKQLGRLDDAYNPDKTPEQRQTAQNKLWKYAFTTANRVNKFRAAATGDPKKPDVIIFRKGAGSDAMQAARWERHANLKFLFVLKQSVEQPSNPNVLPPDLQEFAIQQVKEAVS